MVGQPVATDLARTDHVIQRAQGFVHRGVVVGSSAINSSGSLARAIAIITFIDTPGAYPGVGAEERGQSEAIARNLREMSGLTVPVICTVIGEGGSGGALAIGVGDKVNMLQYSTYSVISPEGCASILWKSADKAPLAADAMGITAPRLKELKLIDSVIPEPLGGAHRDVPAIAASLKAQLLADLGDLDVLETEELLNRRYQRLMNYGYC